MLKNVGVSFFLNGSGTLFHFTFVVSFAFRILFRSTSAFNYFFRLTLCFLFFPGFWLGLVFLPFRRLTTHHRFTFFVSLLHFQDRSNPQHWLVFLLILHTPPEGYLGKKKSSSYKTKISFFVS